MKVHFFNTADEFRAWLEKHHLTENELFVGFYKVNSGKPSMSWSESVDQALCFGWIDGVRRSIDAESYQIRFTPRRETSIWSEVNIQKVAQLTSLGLMKPAGIAIFEKRREEKSGIYTHENEEMEFSEEFREMLQANTVAQDYFYSLPASYQKLSKNWVMSAKQEATRVKRMQELLKESEAQTNRWRNNKYTSR